MVLEEFIQHFAEQFDDTDVSMIQAETKFKELEEWSSLLAMSVIALAKTRYNKVVTGKEIRSCETVKDLFELIASK